MDPAIHIPYCSAMAKTSTISLKERTELIVYLKFEAN